MMGKLCITLSLGSICICSDQQRLGKSGASGDPLQSNLLLPLVKSTQHLQLLVLFPVLQQVLPRQTHICGTCVCSFDTIIFNLS